MFRIAIPALALLAASQLVPVAWIQLKGQAGQWLMERAWATGDGPRADLPWPGARTRPVARLYVPALKLDRLVVEDTATPNLAWGPGMRNGPNGHRIIAAHRDTHFGFLGDLRPGQAIELESPAGVVQHWIVERSRIVDARTTAIDPAAAGPLLSLITCWPIDAIEAGGPLRLVVTAVPEQRSAAR